MYNHKSIHKSCEIRDFYVHVATAYNWSINGAYWKNPGN